MFATLSRGSSRIRNANLCSACIWHAEQQLSHVVSKSGRPIGTSTFSTTSPQWQAEVSAEGPSESAATDIRDDQKDRGIAAENGGEEPGAKIQTSQRKHKPKLMISADRNILDALRVSLLAEEESAVKLQADT